jgi:hypothetical protein
MWQSRCMTRRRVVSTRTEITRREFFAAIREDLPRRLPPDLAAFQWRATMNLIKVYYRVPRLHYEVWVNARDGHIEVGLHFEDGPESTEQLIRHFDRHIVEIKHRIGPEVELERWTKSWGRVFQLLPYQPLTEDLASGVSERLAGMIAVLQPLLDEALAALPTRR